MVNFAMDDDQIERESCGLRAEQDDIQDIRYAENEDNKSHDGTNDTSEKTQSDNEEICGSQNSSTISIKSILDATRCSESLPSSGSLAGSQETANEDSNKENSDSNNFHSSSCCTELDTDSTVTDDMAQYDKTDLIPLPELLKMHLTQIVSGFEFGEATKRRAQENMKTARNKNLNEHSKHGEFSIASENGDENEGTKPCCSKTLSEQAHKTPHSYKRQRLIESKANLINSEKEFPKHKRRIPGCLEGHPDCIEVWFFMVNKEEAVLKLRNARLFNDFKSVSPRMRAILLDWLMEVASVYHLRRVTYYLSVDYFDRFLSIRPDIPKSLLQLVGITCLYIAAKVEEIYPPNLSEFAYVCDGACKSKEIVSCELLILNSLGWEVVLTTASDWLNLYMQFHCRTQDIVRSKLSLDFNKDFLFPQFSAYQFSRASQLMDLLSLDPGFLKFGYSVVAAAAMYYIYGEEVALQVSGLSWTQLRPCVEYMEAFDTIINDASDPRLESCLGVPPPDDISRSTSNMNRLKSGLKNENYSFQTHVANMDYFEKATIYRLSQYKSQKSVEINNEEGQENNEDDSTDVSVGTLSKDSQESDDTGLASELASLEDLSKNDDDEDDGESSNTEQNLMSLDEILEFIMSQDEQTSSEHSN